MQQARILASEYLSTTALRARIVYERGRNSLKQWWLRQHYGEVDSESKEGQERGQLLEKERMGDGLLNPPPKKPRCFLRNALLIAGAVVIICITGLLLQLLTNIPASPHSHILHCGNSTAEARALGCSYDPLAMAWVPEPCLDYETMREYMGAGTWQPFSDMEGTQPIDFKTMSESAKPGPPYVTSAIDHGVHCAFWLKRLIKFKDQWERFGEYDTGEHHINHCVDLVVEFIVGGPAARKDPFTYHTVKQWVTFSTCVVNAD